MGKSSLLNFITNQQVAIVSPQAGTTTDPVRRGFEILDFSPVTFIDTAGIEDLSELGSQRIQRTMATIKDIDLAILVTDQPELSTTELKLIEEFRIAGAATLIIYNNYKKQGEWRNTTNETKHINIISSSLDNSDNSREIIIEGIKKAIPTESMVTPSFFGNRLNAQDVVLLVCPIDSEAPSGRLILPQVQAIRSALDTHAISIVIQPEQLEQVVRLVPNIKLIVTDSQLFGSIQAPAGIELTSFSILLSELKGDPNTYRHGLSAIDSLDSNSRILILEHCSHQTSCEDIGRVKIPNLLRRYTKCDDLNIDFRGPRDILPDSLIDYSLIIQCGGCMVSRRAIQNRIREASENNVPITNYGMLLRHISAKR